MPVIRFLPTAATSFVASGASSSEIRKGSPVSLRQAVLFEGREGCRS